MYIFNLDKNQDRIIVKFFGIKIKFRRNKKDKILYKMGEYSYSGARFISPNVTIGKYCSIGDNAYIGIDVHPTNYITTSPKLYCVNYKNNYVRFPKIKIGHDVWIGVNAIILPKGGNIGTGAIIAAGAVVTKDVPPYAIVAGVPARIIKYRYEKNTIEKMLNSKWWEIPHEKLCEFDLKDVNKFLTEVEKYNDR